MRSLYVIAALALLAACGSNETADNYGYGWGYDEAGVTGLRVRYYDSTSPRIAAFERVYREVAACMGMLDDLTHGPLVIVTTGIIGPDGEVKYGRTYLATGTILLDATIQFHLPGGMWTFRHELVHFFLHTQGFPIEANQQHRSQLFTTCTAP